VLNQSVTRSALGGALLTRCMQQVLEKAAEAKGTKLMARHMFKKVPLDGFKKYEVRFRIARPFGVYKLCLAGCTSTVLFTAPKPRP